MHIVSEKRADGTPVEIFEREGVFYLQTLSVDTGRVWTRRYATESGATAAFHRILTGALQLDRRALRARR